MSLNANRISADLNPKEILALNQNLDAMDNVLNFLIGLSPEERKTLPKIQRDNKFFVADGIDALKLNPEFLPPFVDGAEIEKDFTLFLKLENLYLRISSLSERIKDTMTMAGSEAYSGILAYYRSVNQASEMGMPGADTIKARLARRFESQGNNTPRSIKPENEADAPEQSQSPESTREASPLNQDPDNSAA